MTTPAPPSPSTVPAVPVVPARTLLITDYEFIAQYLPIKNKFDKNAGYDGALHETYGAELEAVKAASGDKVWTLMDDDNGEPVISAGWSYVNRIGYFITEKPHQNINTLVIDEPADFFKRAKRQGELRRLDTVYELSEGMRTELQACQRAWSKARKPA